MRMKISPNGMYNTRTEAKDTIREFHMVHPNSSKKFKIRKEIVYLIDEV